MHFLWSLYTYFHENLTWLDVLWYLTLLLLTWLIYKAAIEPFMSPLRKLPGTPYSNPLLGDMRMLMKGEALETTLKLVGQYGPLLRYYFMFGRERVLVADPQIMKYIFITNASNYIKPPERIKIMRIILGKGLVTSEGTLHNMHKKLMSPAFSTHSITKMIPVFESCCTKLVDYWKNSLSSGTSALLPVHADITRTTLDIIGLTAFGYDFNSLLNPDHEISRAFQSILSGAGLSWRNLLPFTSYLPFPETLLFKKNLKIMNGFVNEIIDKKRDLLKQGTDMNKVISDVLGMMMVARDEETGMGLSDEELRDEVMTLMLAGHETTAVAMAWCLLMLATHQNIQDQARDEILAVVGPVETLTYESIDKLEYCACIVKETLRFFPPVPMTLRMAEKADVLPGNHDIPAGTILLMSIGAMMRREELFPDANSFVPERFLLKEPTDSSVYQYAPFVYGPRQCLGYRFAPIEMKVFLVTLLRHFRFDIDPTCATYKRVMSITMRPSPPLQLRVSLVSSS